MEQPSNRLYSGTLSLAAQKVLAVLRAQSLRADRHSLSSPYNHRQLVERYNDNQRELLAHSSWRMSQEESSAREREWPQVSTFSSCYDSSNWWQSVQTSDCFLSSQATSYSSSRWESSLPVSQIALYYQCSPMNSQRSQSDPSTYQSNQAHPFTLHDVDEAATPLSHRETNTSCSPMPERPLEFQATPWRNSHQRIRTSFIHNSELPDEVFSMAEHPKAPEDSQASSCPQKSEETDNTSGEQKGKGVSDICNLNECEDKQGADSVEKWKLTGPDAAELTISAEDRGMQLQQTQSETKNLNPSSSRQNPLVLDSGSTENEQYAKWKEGECGKASTCKFFECDRQREKLVTKEGNDFVCRFTTPKIEEVEQPPTSINVKILMGSLNGSPIRPQSEDHEESQSQPANTQYTKGVADKLELTREQTVNTEEETESSTMECTDEVCPAPHLCSNIHLTEAQRETDRKEIQEQSVRDNDVTEGRRDRAECTHTVDRTRDSGSTPTLSLKCRAKRSAFRAPCLLQRNYNIEISKGNIRRSSSSMTTSTFADGHTSSSVHDLVFASIKGSKKVRKINLRPSLVRSRPPLIALLPLKRKHKMRENKNAHSLPKIIRHPPKWNILHCSQKMTRQGEVKPELKGATPKTLNTECLTVTKLQTDVSVHVEGDCNDQHDPKQSQKNQQLILSHVTWQPLKRNNCEPYREVNGPKIPNEEANGNEPYNHAKPSYFLSTLTSDPRVKDCEKLNMDEKMEIFEEVRKAKALILTLVYRDGTTQLDPEQKLTPPACGLLMLIKNSADSSIADDSLGPNEILVYLKLDHTPTWTQQHTHQNQEVFAREMLLHVLSNSQPVVCYKAKDLLCTALQFYRREISWKQVAGSHIQDPQVSGWLLDPANPCSRYRDLLYKHSKRICATSSLGFKKVSQIISDLCSLYWLNMELVSKLQNQGLWELYTDMELNMISVLAVMESHHIHVDKEALKRMSELLGTKMKQLEQEAHRAAGQIFLVTSNSQLRKVLFEKLCLHEQCENKKLPKTLNKQQQSTSEAALLQLQDLHPLPKIILEYRQVHKIKSTFVDGILSCMMNKNYISTKWYQTSVVTGRISAKHPNFQAVPRQPLKISKTQRVPGTEGELVSIHPRAMFIPQEGWTFLAADFCQVELRLLAHLSADPELLHIFTDLQTDVFTMLASQWKGVSQGEVTSEDREHTKRIVYSVVYGAGRERLSGILGVSAEQAGQFLDTFLQTYKEVPAFIHRIIQQCHQQGYVLSIMGRRRTLPNINSPDWGIRMQAERQAVNFVVQGSAADLCKMAMIRIFNLVSSSSLSARLIAQLHDELLYEVEDAQVEEFAALVKRTMESLQHIDHLGVHLKVPLKVAVSCGKSWGFMSELNIPPTSPSPL